jgi:hypothetical protein
MLSCRVSMDTAEVDLVVRNSSSTAFTITSNVTRASGAPMQR